MITVVAVEVITSTPATVMEAVTKITDIDVDTTDHHGVALHLVKKLN